MNKDILDNDEDSRDQFQQRMGRLHAGGNGGTEWKISLSDLQALHAGKVLAIDDGEFSQFLTLEEDARK